MFERRSIPEESSKIFSHCTILITPYSLLVRTPCFDFMEKQRAEAEFHFLCPGGTLVHEATNLQDITRKDATLLPGLKVYFHGLANPPKCFGEEFQVQS